MPTLMGVIIKSRLLPPGPTEVTWDVTEPGLQAGPSDHAGIPPPLSERGLLMNSQFPTGTQ